LRDTAPAEVAEPVTLIADTYAEGLETGNFEFINEAFIGSDTEVDTYLLEIASSTDDFDPDDPCDLDPYGCGASGGSDPFATELMY
jgi:hypothetical protein